MSVMCLILKSMTSGIDRLHELQSTYRNLPMSLADACLVRISELHSRSRVFTTDSDFRTYRRNGRQVIPTLLPDNQNERSLT